VKLPDIGPPTPVTFKRGDASVRDDEISLTLVLVLRRVRAGASIASAVRDLDLSYSSVANQLHHARRRLGVSTNDELIALPAVRRQLDGESA